MKVCIIGVGYVGLTTAAVLADMGHQVTCVDKDAHKLAELRAGRIPFYEPGLDELVARGRANGRLTFTADLPNGLAEASVVMIAVGTPAFPDGRCNLTYVWQAVDELAQTLTHPATVIVKSTVPPGTTAQIQRAMAETSRIRAVHVVANPEFLREGSAVADTRRPDRIVVGVTTREALVAVRALYQGIDAPYVVTTPTGAEMIKYAANAFLATKISFINEMARICDAYGVRVDDVAEGIGLDARIGRAFLRAGLGYGGSCLPKDVDALIHAARDKGVDPLILPAVQQVNATQPDLYARKLRDALGGLAGKRVAVWGIAFKPNTDDTRASQALALIDRLLAVGCTVRAFDPLARCERPEVAVATDPYQAAADADALVVATEWDLFRRADWSRVKAVMRGNVVVDGRNCLDPETVRAHGLRYVGVARP
ncbi:UDP-glucose dehydrogenase family protein [Calditerricola satsumensis]|uniref:UDP-glucose 6-dehydrogenase n=1 Tax=Calditerricola satsumensis TaxID=373054 RepID=A0A8J3BF81_9BACI|nr:UDP-glucose/GDP-mannose dehydrogenase family protein [Calditerricola satsumensis]GGK03110.1 UDP-glucose 6-dehydrogenase [Calditerricola satsumensis]